MNSGDAAPGAAGERAPERGLFNGRPIVGPSPADRQLAASVRRLLYFQLLSSDEQQAAIRKLAASGMGLGSIAAAAAVSVEQVRELLAADGSDSEPAS